MNPYPDCGQCDDTGVYGYVCWNDTCDLTDFCDCPVGVREKARWEQAQAEYRERIRLQEIEARRVAMLPRCGAHWFRDKARWTCDQLRDHEGPCSFQGKAAPASATPPKRMRSREQVVSDAYKMTASGLYDWVNDD